MGAVFSKAVITVDRFEGNESVGTEWQDTYLVPLDMTLREALTQMFGEAPPIADKGAQKRWLPKGRVSLTVPDTLPIGEFRPTQGED